MHVLSKQLTPYISHRLNQLCMIRSDRVLACSVTIVSCMAHMPHVACIGCWCCMMHMLQRLSDLGTLHATYKMLPNDGKLLGLLPQSGSLIHMSRAGLIQDWMGAIRRDCPGLIDPSLRIEQCTCKIELDTLEGDLPIHIKHIGAR